MGSNEMSKGILVLMCHLYKTGYNQTSACQFSEIRKLLRKQETDQLPFNWLQNTNQFDVEEHCFPHFIIWGLVLVLTLTRGKPDKIPFNASCISDCLHWLPNSILESNCSADFFLLVLKLWSILPASPLTAVFCFVFGFFPLRTFTTVIPLFEPSKPKLYSVIFRNMCNYRLWAQIYWCLLRSKSIEFSGLTARWLKNLKWKKGVGRSETYFH